MQLGLLAKGLTHLFYPTLCEGCTRQLVAGEHILCLSCETSLAATGNHNIPDNETELRFAGRIPFMHATSFGYFTDEGLLQHLMHRLKYQNRKDIGIYLGNLLGRSLMESEWMQDIDAIVPVPLHHKKEAKRGYNQSALIAQGIASATNKPVRTNLLLRTRNTESQTNKTRVERIDNMQGAFRIAENQIDASQHILLCDDVLTTGATLEACALALMAEKSIKISIATIGIAIS